MEQNSFTIRFDKFFQGYSPLWASNSLTSLGNAGMASVMSNVDVLSADYLTQGPTLSSLGTVNELITFILDKATSDNVSYAIGTTKLFKLSSTALISGGSPSWPQVITSCADGESLVDMGGNLYGFYNKSSGGDILKMPLSTEIIDPDWGSEEEASGGPIGHAALQKALHPSASKEDLIVFGNGRYCGVYTGGSDTLEVDKLDFGEGNEMADVVFHANQWWIAVNSGTTSGANRNFGHIYLYDGSATTAILADETSIGYQRIGFLMPLNGIMFVAYQDLTATDGYKIGYIIGRQLKPLASFSGSLPLFYQKTLFKSTILFISGGLVYSCGAIDDNLPIQISQLADGGYSTVGAIACPFGTPIVASTQSTSFQLAKFANFDTACSWKSIIIPVSQGRNLGYIDTIVVYTKTLAASARADLVLEYNQNSSNSGTAKQITGEGLRRFVFPINSGGIEDFRVSLSWANGHASNDCAIRSIVAIGHYVER